MCASSDGTMYASTPACFICSRRASTRSSVTAPLACASAAMVVARRERLAAELGAGACGALNLHAPSARTTRAAWQPGTLGCEGDLATATHTGTQLIRACGSARSQTVRQCAATQQPQVPHTGLLPPAPRHRGTKQNRGEALAVPAGWQQAWRQLHDFLRSVHQRAETKPHDALRCRPECPAALRLWLGVMVSSQ